MIGSNYFIYFILLRDISFQKSKGSSTNLTFNIFSKFRRIDFYSSLKASEVA